MRMALTPFADGDAKAAPTFDPLFNTPLRKDAIMTSQFDASLAHSDPISPEVLAEQRDAVEAAMRMPSALANAKLHAENELKRLIVACNRLVWGSATPDDTRAPTEEEIRQMMEHFAGEAADRLRRDSKLAAEQRSFLAKLSEAESAYLMRLQAEEAENTRQEQVRLQWEEFEAHDAAGKQQRFEAWLASRRQ